MMTQMLPSQQTVLNASKYDVKVMDHTDSDDLAVLKKLREHHC